MFQSLSDRLSGILDKLTRRGALTDSDVAEAMREVRRALLEADVALEVAPVKGNAVFFSYDRPHPVTRTLHGGAPVIAASSRAVPG